MGGACVQDAAWTTRVVKTRGGALGGAVEAARGGAWGVACGKAWNGPGSRILDGSVSLRMWAGPWG